MEERRRDSWVPTPGELVDVVKAAPDTRLLCVHCNRCMTTICTGTHCVLTGSDGA